MIRHAALTLKDVLRLTYRILSPLKGIPPFLFVVGNLCFWVGPLFFLALIKLLVPLEKIRSFCYRIMTRIYTVAVCIDDQLLWRLMGIRMEVRGLKRLSQDKIYLVLANHQSWADIFVLQSILSFKTHIPNGRIEQLRKIDSERKPELYREAVEDIVRGSAEVSSSGE